MEVRVGRRMGDKGEGEENAANDIFNIGFDISA